LLVLLIGAGAGVVWKFDLINWWRNRAPKPSGELKVYVLDVGPGEGDSILIISPTGQSVLIDAGDTGKGKNILLALKKYKVDRLDYFVATHPHPDHIGGADEVMNAIKIGTVIDNGVDLSTPAPEVPAAGKGKGAKAPPPPPKKKVKSVTTFFDEYAAALKQNGATYEKAEPGRKYDLGGGAILSVIAPNEPLFLKEQMKTGGNETNANSIVLRLVYGDFTMLFMGDAESQTESRLLGKKDLDLEAKVIKVGHHGSKYATSEEFIKRVKPEAAIISDGLWNRYGHPAQSVLDRLKAANAKVFRTDLQGDITITTKGKGDSNGAHVFEIKPAKEAAEDVWTGREAMKDDASRSGFIAYGDFGPPPKPKTEKTKKK
jgi:beta-lactamase superfamily II metal-dependent hydrolase